MNELKEVKAAVNPDEILLVVDAMTGDVEISKQNVFSQEVKGAELTLTGKDSDGNVIAVHCEYDKDSRGGNPADGRKIKSTIHWVDSKTCIDAEIRLYDKLFTTEQPDLADCNYLDFINPDSLKIIKGAKVEASLAPSVLSPCCL